MTQFLNLVCAAIIEYITRTQLLAADGEVYSDTCGDEKNSGAVNTSKIAAVSASGLPVNNDCRYRDWNATKTFRVFSSSWPDCDTA
jgi:hypothetical protein